MIPINELKRSFQLFQNEYEQKALQVLRKGYYILGEEVSAFETEFAEHLGGGSFCAGVDSGLDAILFGMMAAGISPGDEVIVQANGYIATVLAVIHTGATPVFVEANEHYEMDADCIKKAITNKTKAILVTHLYGGATRMQAIADICKQHKLLLFEDCAQSHFATYKGTYVGLFGDVSFFSSYPTKLLGGFGDGGCVVAKDERIIDRVKTIRNYGSDYRYHNIMLGYNGRLDELQAGLLRVKLAHMEEILENRRHIANRYLNEIRSPLISLPQVPEECQNTWYQFVIQVEEQDRFIQHMKNHGIATDITWKTPVYLQPAIANLFGYRRGDFPVTDYLCEHIVSIPMMDVMHEDEITKIIKAVNAYE